MERTGAIRAGPRRHAAAGDPGQCTQRQGTGRSAADGPAPACRRWRRRRRAPVQRPAALARSGRSRRCAAGPAATDRGPQDAPEATAHPAARGTGATVLCGRRTGARPRRRGTRRAPAPADTTPGTDRSAHSEKSERAAQTLHRPGHAGGCLRFLLRPPAPAHRAAWHRKFPAGQRPQTVWPADHGHHHRPARTAAAAGSDPHFRAAAPR